MDIPYVSDQKCPLTRIKIPCLSSEKWPTFCKRLLPHWSRGSFHCCFVVHLVRNEEWLAKPGWHWVLFGILLHLFCWNVLSQKGAKKRWTYVLIWDRHGCSHKVHITEEIKLHHTWLHTNRWQCQHFFFETDKKISWHATSVNQGKHVTEVSNSTKHMERAFCCMKKVFL